MYSKSMKSILLALVLFAVPGCPQLQQGPGPDFPTVDEAKDCAKEGAKDEFYNWLPRVNTFIASGGGWGTLINEVVKGFAGFTVNGIECLIEKIGSDSARAAAADGGNAIAAAKSERARVLLEVLQEGRDADRDVSLAEWFEKHGAAKAEALSAGG